MDFDDISASKLEKNQKIHHIGSNLKVSLKTKLFLYTNYKCFLKELDYAKEKKVSIL
jgi:hypothetical protein